MKKLLPLLLLVCSCSESADEFFGRTAVVKDIDTEDDSVSSGKDVRINLRAATAEFNDAILNRPEYKDLYVLVRYSPDLRFSDRFTAYDINAQTISPFNVGSPSFGRLEIVCEGYSARHGDNYIGFRIDDNEFEDAYNEIANLEFYLTALNASADAVINATGFDNFSPSECENLNPKPDVSTSIRIR
jgi:hypothetical protein